MNSAPGRACAINASFTWYGAKTRRRRKFAEQTLRERPDDDRVDPPFEISRHVGNRLALAERHIGLQRDHLAAELADSDLECGSRAQRRLLEQQRHMTAVQGRGH